MGRYIFLIFIFLNFSLFSQDTTSRDFYLKGEEAFNNYDYYLAYEYFNNALTNNNKYYKPLIGLAKVLFIMQEYGQALEYVNNALKFDKNSLELLNLKGRILIGLGDFSQANKIFDTILISEPYNLEAKLGKNDLNVVYGSYDIALKEYKKLLTLSPNNRRTLLSLVLMLDSINKSDEADKYIDRILELFPNDINARLLAAKHYKKIKRFDDAYFNAKLALNIKPDFLDAAIIISKISFQNGRYDEVIETMRPLLDFKDDRYIIYYYLGEAYTKLNLPESALNCYKDALKLRPGDEGARVALENILIENSYKNKLSESLSNYHFIKGDEFYNRNIPYKGYQEFRRGLALEPLSKKGNKGVGSYYKKNKLFSKYFEILNFLRGNYPDDINIDDEMEKLKFMLEDSVAKKWNVNQFEVTKDTIDISIFVEKNDDSVYHYNLESHFLNYFTHYISSYERFNVNYAGGLVSSYSDAFKTAKQNGSNYFIILKLEENSRTITIDCNIYWSSTGILLDSWTISRTGNDKLLNSCDYIVNYLITAQPKIGTILQINFDKAIINLGNIDNIKKGEKFNIVKKGYIFNDKSGFKKIYNDRYVLGTFTVEKCDDLISEGVLEKRYYYNLINEDDSVILQTEPLSTPKDNQVGRELYREMLKLG